MPEQDNPISYEEFLVDPRQLFDDPAAREGQVVLLDGTGRLVAERADEDLQAKLRRLPHSDFWSALAQCLARESSRSSHTDSELDDMVNAMAFLAPDESVPLLHYKDPDTGEVEHQVVALPKLFDPKLRADPIPPEPGDKPCFVRTGPLVRGKWYKAQPWHWKRRGLFSWWPDRELPPRRDLALSFCRSIENYLYPAGMPRSLYGSYLLFLMAYRPLVESLGVLPWYPFRDDRAAEQHMDRAAWPPLQRDDDDQAWIERRVLEGVYPVPWRVGRDANHVRAVFEWNDCRFRESAWRDTWRAPQWPPKPSQKLPNLTAEFRVHEREQRLQLVSIEVQYRRWSWGSRWLGRWSMQPARTVTPDDGAVWERSLQLLQGALFLQSEIEVHLARCHHFGEYIQVALHQACEATGCDPRGDFLRIWKTLLPHVNATDMLNLAADTLITGGRIGILPNATPLHWKALRRRIGRDMGAMDWKGFVPRRPLLAQADLYARAAGHFWERLVPYVRDRLQVGDDDEDAPVEPQVRRLSEILRSGGLVHRPFQGLSRDSPKWHDAVRSELPTPRSRRRPAFSPIETRGDMAQFVAYAIFHCTFVHTWSNNSQWVDGGDPRKAPMSVRADIFDAVADPANRVPDGAIMALQKLVTNALTKMDMGYVLVNDMLPLHDHAFVDMVCGLDAPFQDPQDTEDPDFRLRKDHIRSRVCA
ncbi:MAG: hypothetical protein KTR31_34470 [Myxococcales bacterium]|nr:hypothetical protein [Myxococcales bacterium]